MLNEALHYLTLGMSVIPLKPNSKEPLINWKPYQSQRASESEVKEWFQKWPNANIGVLTGSISGLAIIDLDGPEGLQQGQLLGLSSPLLSITGRGKQLWFQNPIGISVPNSVKIALGIDVRGEGGYVVSPPSVHPNGKRYRFNRSLTVSVVESLPLFPMDLFAKGVQSSQTSTLAKVGNPKGWIAEALNGMQIGNIDDTIFKICSRMRNDGYTEEDARTLLRPHSDLSGAEPGHLEDKIRNVWGRYSPSDRVQRRDASSVQSHGSLVLHSPTNPDSCAEYDKRTMDSNSSDNLKTGYARFDEITKGLRKGECLVVAARTGVGKTNWILTPIRTFCETGKKVLLFSTEMSFDQIWGRYIATLRSGLQFSDHSFFICDEFTPDIERIEEAIKNVRPDLFLFDHISHIGTDYHIISKFMSEIKRLARLYSIPAIVTAQLNRNADYVEAGTRIEPRLSMIQGSDQIGQMSAQVLLLNEKRINGDVVEIEGIVVKNRHGDKGMVQFGLVKNPYRMIEL